MEILILKISEQKNMANHYEGVIAYGTGADGKTYVLKVQPEKPKANQNSFFVILEAKDSQTHTIFNEDDEMGLGIVFDWYDEAILEFQYFLDGYCLEYPC